MYYYLQIVSPLSRLLCKQLLYPKTVVLGCPGKVDSFSKAKKSSGVPQNCPFNQIRVPRTIKGQESLPYTDCHFIFSIFFLPRIRWTGHPWVYTTIFQCRQVAVPAALASTNFTFTIMPIKYIKSIIGDPSYPAEATVVIQVQLTVDLTQCRCVDSVEFIQPIVGAELFIATFNPKFYMKDCNKVQQY